MAAAVSAALIAGACSDSKSGVTSATTAPGGATATGKDGGKLTMGVEAEVDGFNPVKNRWDVTGLIYANTVYDPLTKVATDGTAHPYLAESVEHNADYSVWTVKLRSGVTFHDGSPASADDVVANLQAHQKSALTAPAISNIDTVTKVDALTTSIKMKTPWVPFPVYLAGQVGMLAKASTLTDDAAQRNPIGTGPFKIKEWVPGDHFTAEKNPTYWQKGLPHLDSITYRPIVEPATRGDALKAGNVDLLHTTETHTIKAFQADKSFKLQQQTKGELEENMIMLNTAKEPFDNPLARLALAQATDRESYQKIQADGIPPLADSPFSKGSFYASDGDIGYPKFDLTAAKATVKQYEAQAGKKLSFEFGTTNAGRNLEQNQFIAEQWKAAGIDAKIVQVQQSQYIQNALLGSFQAYGWRQFGEPDPDADVVWWISATAAPIGSLSLNFARNKDPLVDKSLIAGRTSPDPAVRKAAYQDIAKQFAKDLPFIWTVQTVWAVASKPTVGGIEGAKLPDGTDALTPTGGLVQAVYLTAA
jgi:peptide/nickel transport system substrate-binding protein